MIYIVIIVLLCVDDNGQEWHSGYARLRSCLTDKDAYILGDSTSAIRQLLVLRLMCNVAAEGAIHPTARFLIERVIGDWAHAVLSSCNNRVQ